MVITPVVPASPPELGDAPLPRTLPFRRDSDFVQMLKSAAQAASTRDAAPADHRVQPGESLWRICEDALKSGGGAPSKSDINAAVRRVAAANRLKNADVLSVGQRLDMTSVRGGTPTAALSKPGVALPSSRGAATELPGPLQAAPSAALKPRPAELGAPLAALAGTWPAPMGGVTTAPRPIFHRLSNARPALRSAPHVQKPTADVAAVTAKPVDLTALMQSILEPRPDTAEAPAAVGPWAKLLAGAGRFTSGFGMRSDPFSGKLQFHEGIDIAAAAGTEIYPYMPGTVKSAGWDAGHGNSVVIEHPDGTETVYAHASETLVKAGDIVMKDTPIAKVGSTGRSTGAHLHFEVRQNNKAINPLPLLTQPSLDIAKAL